MTSGEIETWLVHKGVKPTANRILVYKTLLGADCPLTLSDIEAMQLQMDKSSIFRVLTLFHEHDVVHSFEDGRGVLNYELCHSDGICSRGDSHVHFYCESCRRSFCLDSVHVGDIPLPEGFHAHSFSFVVKGECPDCRKKNPCGDVL